QFEYLDRRPETDAVPPEPPQHEALRHLPWTVPHSSDERKARKLAVRPQQEGKPCFAFVRRPVVIKVRISILAMLVHIVGNELGEIVPVQFHQPPDDRFGFGRRRRDFNLHSSRTSEAWPSAAVSI